MKFPTRPDAHITETESWRLLQTVAPREWIVREVSERDYGIDAYIELVSKTGLVTGDLMSVQLKAVENLDWGHVENGWHVTRSPSAKSTTATYWLHLPVPVFLFVADLHANDIFFTPVQEHIRINFQKLDNQKTMTFPLSKELSLTTDRGLARLNNMYIRERLHEQFAFHISNLIQHVDMFADFIRVNQNRDIFLEVDTDRHLQFRALYESCRMASIYLDRDWPVDSLSELYRKDYKEWKDDYTLLHERTLDGTLQVLEKLFPDLARKAIELVTVIQSSYWEDKDPIFFRLCGTGELEWILKRIEHEVGL